MCFSATASFTAAALLVPAGGLAVHRAFREDRRYLALAALPMLLGVQQFMEGMVWTAGARGNTALVGAFSLAYMFFAWLAWPVWIPLSAYLLERERRRTLYLLFAIAGAMLGALQYVPYFAHDGWLVTTFLDNAISYGGTELLDFVTGRTVTYTIYLTVLVVPLLLSSDRRVRVFGGLVGLTFVVTYLFFRFAYISVFCFGGALVSVYLLPLIFTRTRRPRGAVLAAA